MTSLSLTTDYAPATHPALPSDLLEGVTAAVSASKAANTLRAYQSDLAQFTRWCDEHSVISLPAHPETVAAYVVSQRAGRRLSTLRRHLATISKAHQIAGLPNPCRTDLVRDTVTGLARQYPQAADRAPAMTPAYLRQVLSGIRGSELADLRDRAALLVGWCAALRRSELAGLRWGDIEQRPDGAVLTLLGTKTDHTGGGQRAPLATETRAQFCPVRALRAWQAVCSAAGSDLVAPDQPVFRQVSRHGALGSGLSPHAVGQIVTRRGAAVGLTGLTGHSLRRGLVQAAHLAGVGDTAIMQTTRHRSVAQVRTYQGDAGLVDRAASRGLLAK